MMLYTCALNPLWTDGAVGVGGVVTLALVVVVAMVMDVVVVMALETTYWWRWGRHSSVVSVVVGGVVMCGVGVVVVTSVV